MLDPTTARVSDPLSLITRKNRIGLLSSSLVAILFVQAGLVPTKLSVFGTQFDNWNNTNLITVNLFVSAYYLLAFSISGISDLMVYKMQIFAADTENDRLYEELLQREADDELTEQDKILIYRHKTHRWIFKASNPIAFLRLVVEFLLPVVIGVYAIGVMFIYIS
jgi:hypothetical protein